MDSSTNFEEAKVQLEQIKVTQKSNEDTSLLIPSLSFVTETILLGDNVVPTVPKAVVVITEGQSNDNPIDFEEALYELRSQFNYFPVEANKLLDEKSAKDLLVSLCSMEEITTTVPFTTSSTTG